VVTWAARLFEKLKDVLKQPCECRRRNGLPDARSRDGGASKLSRGPDPVSGTGAPALTSNVPVHRCAGVAASLTAACGLLDCSRQQLCVVRRREPGGREIACLPTCDLRSGCSRPDRESGRGPALRADLVGAHDVTDGREPSWIRRVRRSAVSDCTRPPAAVRERSQVDIRTSAPLRYRPLRYRLDPAGHRPYPPFALDHLRSSRAAAFGIHERAISSHGRPLPDAHERVIVLL